MAIKETTHPMPTLTHFSVDVADNGIATVLIDVQQTRVNTISEKIDKDLEALMSWLEGNFDIVGVVIGSAKRDFIVGADIASFNNVKSAEDATRLASKLQGGLKRLEDLFTQGKPVVAAINGACLGGGLELALACTMRICSDAPHTVLGLPEVMLGLFPGAGGTQRLPQLIGVTHALDLILTGKKVRPLRAKKLGLVDDVVPQAILLRVAQKCALELSQGLLVAPPKGLARLRQMSGGAPGALKQLALEENAAGQALLFRKAKEQLLQKSRGNYPAPLAALDVIRIGIQEGLAQGYEAEARRFGEMVMTPEAQALISVFFATQKLKKDNGTRNPKTKPRKIHKVGILGGGFMGGGIATVTALKAGLPVRIKDISNEGMALGLRYVRKVLDTDLKRQRRTPAEADRLMHTVTATKGIQGLGNAEIIIEAVFEDLELKQRVLREVETITTPETIFASNTSTLPIAKIAQASMHPETVIGMHYFSPVEKMPLLEIIVTDKTADWVTATCVQLGKDQGKTVVVVRDGTGFYTSRILMPYINEAAWILYQGGDIKEIDEAMRDWGFPVGPATLLDEVGIDVASKIVLIMQDAFGERIQAPAAMDALTQDQRKGRKNGRGLFVYHKGKKRGVDEDVYKLFGQGKRRKHYPKEELQRRMGLQMVNEAVRCLEDGILRSPQDGDIAAIMGLGFPPFTGGPFSYVDSIGADNVVKHLEGFAAEHGPRFAPSELLLRHAQTGKKFRQQR